MKHAVRTTIALVAAVAAALTTATDAIASPQNYYVDCSAATDGTGSITSPWNSLVDANAASFGPGDQLLFKKGATCTGTLSPTGSGSAGSPFVISSYGTSSSGAVIDGGGSSSAIHLYNEQYITLSNLEVTNAANPGTNRRGIDVQLNDFGTGTGYTIQNVYIHDVWGDDTKGPTGSQGIAFRVTGTTVPTTYDQVNITGNQLANIDRQALVLQLSTWNCRTESGCTSTPNWLPATNVVVSNNSLSNIGGDGIVLNTTQNAIAENNTISGFNKRSSAYNAGLWTFNSDGFLAQYNDVSGGVGPLDGMAYDSDGGNNNATFQYNFSHDNTGGFFLFCPYGTTQNNGTIVRYNISQNDSYRGFENCNGTINSAQVYNNTIYIGSGISQVVVNESTTATRNVTMSNNIIYKGGTGSASFNLKAGTSYTFNHNTISSWITGAPSNPGGTTANPLLCNGGTATSRTTANGYRLQPTSPAIGTGTTLSGNGGQDYFGTAIGTPPNIGASETSHC